MQEWINNNVKRGLRLEKQKIRNGQQADVAKVGAECPNCNAGIKEAPVVEEQEAIDQLDNVLGLLESSNLLNSSSSLQNN